MTMQENSNLVKILEAMGLKAYIGDFILGIEGTISPDESARRLLEAIKENNTEKRG